MGPLFQSILTNDAMKCSYFRLALLSAWVVVFPAFGQWAVYDESAVNQLKEVNNEEGN
jgi:hypothetical protein